MYLASVVFGTAIPTFPESFYYTYEKELLEFTNVLFPTIRMLILLSQTLTKILHCSLFMMDMVVSYMYMY